MQSRINLVLILMLAIAGCAQSGDATRAAGKASRENVVVQFTNMSIHPEVAKVPTGASVVWNSMTSELEAVISFPLSVVASFTCIETRPNFYRTDTRLVSIPVRVDSENVSLPCPLKTGEYEYRIDLYSGGMAGNMAGMENPLRSLNGKLVVD